MKVQPSFKVFVLNLNALELEEMQDLSPICGDWETTAKLLIVGPEFKLTINSCT